MTRTERLADNKRRDKIASEEYDRRAKILDDYLNSPTVKRLRKDAQDAIDAVNAIIGEWNDIIMEEHYERYPKGEPDNEKSGNPVSVDGRLVYGYKDDPKSW
jgi:hypothetical protein